MRFIYQVFPGFYVIKYTFLGMILPFIIISSNVLLWSNGLFWILLGLSILLPTNFYPSWKKYGNYYGAIGVISITLTLFVSMIFVNIFQFVGLCACKVWILSDNDDPNYPLNVNFFNSGVVTFTIFRLQPTLLIIFFLLLCNLICIILVDYIWARYRIVGVLKH